MHDMNNSNDARASETHKVVNQSVPAWDFSHVTNVGHTLTEAATRMHDAIAVAAPKRKYQPAEKVEYNTITFGELESLSNRMAIGLRNQGVETGDRIALMVPPGLEFVALVFALFKAGATIILIDPGMGKKNMVTCLSDANPVGIVGIRRAHLARTVYRRKFKNAKKNFVVGGYFPSCYSVKKFESLNASEFQPVSIAIGDPAAIIFTTGSTGPPKGVLYRHQIFIEQARQIRDYFQIPPGTVDVSGFPLFALFNSAMGATTVFPMMDATRPAEIHPPFLIDAVERFKADQSFGSPALWNTVSKWCEQNSVTMPTVKRVLSAGAPVPAHVLQRIKQVISPDGDAFTPYGATESLPIACNSATVILNETAATTDSGGGTCVGNRFPDIDWRLIEISDEPLESIEQTNEVEPGRVGELIVRGPVVSQQYVTRTDANAEHKIVDGDSFWHRMGDIGYFDERDRFWFCGRKTHRVQTAWGDMFTIPCEGIFNPHQKIYRSALVGVGDPGNQTPVLIAEPWASQWPESASEKEKLLGELKELAAQHWQTSTIANVLLHQSLPVDIRHNSKIFREQLRIWATARI
jgi:acyl-CoA synthetase (AMP-forming)/AMP-acid ligase II